VKVLVIDVGGSSVKMHGTGWPEPKRIESGSDLTPEKLVEIVRDSLQEWECDVVALGYPGEAARLVPKEEPGNLALGWVGFDFASAFGKPTRLVNDAAMQALGGYTGGRMLFLGLGTGLGSAFVTDRVVLPLELGRLCLGRSASTLSDRLGNPGLEKMGKARWNRLVIETATMLRGAFAADYVVLGGGNARNVGALPDGVRRGGNDDAFVGGFRLWEADVELHETHSTVWRIVP